jgi:hypothetical protein
MEMRENVIVLLWNGTITITAKMKITRATELITNYQSPKAPMLPQFTVVN